MTALGHRRWSVVVSPTAAKVFAVAGICLHSNEPKTFQEGHGKVHMLRPEVATNSEGVR